MTIVPSEVYFSSQTTPPVTDMCYHSHVFPQDCSTSRNVDSVGFCIVHGVVKRRRQCSPSRVGCTDHIISCSWLGWLWEYVNPFGFHPETNTSSDLLSIFFEVKGVLCFAPEPSPYPVQTTYETAYA